MTSAEEGDKENLQKDEIQIVQYDRLLLRMTYFIVF